MEDKLETLWEGFDGIRTYIVKNRCYTNREAECMVLVDRCGNTATFRVYPRMPDLFEWYWSSPKAYVSSYGGATVNIADQRIMLRKKVCDKLEALIRAVCNSSIAQLDYEWHKHWLPSIYHVTQKISMRLEDLGILTIEGMGDALDYYMCSDCSRFVDKPSCLEIECKCSLKGKEAIITVDPSKFGTCKVGINEMPTHEHRKREILREGRWGWGNIKRSMKSRYPLCFEVKNYNCWPADEVGLTKAECGYELSHDIVKPMQVVFSHLMITDVL